MLQRNQARIIASRAAEILRFSGAQSRVHEDGYTRVDPFLIASYLDVPVLLRPLEKLLGAFLRESSPGIIINSERPAGLIHMTCAHELGHFYMGHENTADDRIDYGPFASQKEQEADLFAYQLLAPRSLLANILNKKGWSVEDIKSPLKLYQLSLRLGISYTAAAWSLNRCNLLTTNTVNKILQTTPAEIKQSLIGKKLERPTDDVWLIDEADKSSILEPRLEDKIIVRLRNNASSGYLWSADEAQNEGFSVSPILNLSPEDNSDLSRPWFGNRPTMDYIVDQHAPIRIDQPSSLNFAERKPWDNESIKSEFTTQAHFETLHAGLTQAAKQRLLREHTIS